jgi:glycosyltransferase involved in cell wall biosynthesis
MKKILVSAYGCEPFRGSEAGVGWNWILQMAQENKLYVIARANDQKKIETYLPKELENNVTFFYYDTGDLLKKVKKKDKGLYLYYWFWQIGIIPLVRKIIKKYNPDYTMHLTFGSLWMPTFLPFFKTKFIWGPIGGGDGVPKSYLKELPTKQRIVQTARYFLMETSFLNPLVFIPSKKAEVILCRTKNNIEALPKKYRNKARVILETAMDQSEFEKIEIKESSNENIIKIISTGRLVPFKNIVMGIRVIKKIIDEGYEIEYTIIGDGPEKNRLKKLVKNLNIEKNVNFIGQLERNKVLEYLKRSDIYLFPSLREGGSWALMEAMSSGLPVVCFNWTGSGEITDDRSAIRITPSKMSEDIDAFYNALKEMIDNPQKRVEYGVNAKERIENVFNWNIKGQFMKKIFEEIE